MTREFFITDTRKEKNMSAQTATALPVVDAMYLQELDTVSKALEASNGFGLVAFADKINCHKRACELESMVDQTIRAAATNLENNGVPYSFRSPSVFSNGGLDGVDNGTAYGFLVNGGWIVEGQVQASDVKVPPRDLKPVDGEFCVLYPSADLIKLVRIHMEKRPAS